ncbi:MAG TPA: peptidoglycan editing factor PgeF [Terriglobales bacterium]|nr:peptidoglycan editing factor PgeF [Terriglobales bacterium]
MAQVPELKSKTGPVVLTIPGLERLPWLAHGFSTRLAGFSQVYGGRSLNLGFTHDDTREAVERNRAAFLGAIGARGWPMVTARQVHSDIVLRVEGPPAVPLTGDALVTHARGLVLAVKTADCVPILLVDAKKKAVAAIHAGWRGMVKRIVEKTVGVLRREYGSQPGTLHAAIGPGIAACCYAVGDEVREAFDSQFAYAAQLFHEVMAHHEVRERYPLLFLTARAPGHHPLGRKLHLDMAMAAQRQLLDAGVPHKQIFATGKCTSCHNDLLFSHRREKGITGRQVGAIGIRP